MICSTCTTPLTNDALECFSCGAELHGDEETRDESPPTLIGETRGSGVWRMRKEPIRGYTIHDMVGQGGMSTIWRVTHEDHAHSLAMKVLEAAEACEEVIRRFEREAHVLAQLDHPNIVPVHDFFYHEGYFCTVMDFLEGGSLQRFLSKNGTLSEKRALSVGRQVGRGLAAAAAGGVVHRDIKPANLLLGRIGEIRIADFGIAKRPRIDRTQLTSQGECIGTPSYMPPEQWTDCRQVDPRSDLYSLGCALFHLLTGTTPYQGRLPFDQLEGHCMKPVPDVRERRPEVSEELALTIKKLMAKDPVERLQSGAELDAELGRQRQTATTRTCARLAGTTSRPS